jgi:ferredoxin
MIVAKPKPFRKIRMFTDPFENILVVGCNTCVAVCLTGGEKEAEQLASKIRLHRRQQGLGGTVDTVTVLRQCEKEYNSEIAAAVKGRDLLLSTACSIGPQALAEMYTDVRVMPAMNTNMLGNVKEHHVWSEYCVACGDCMIYKTGGLCPIARCAKELLNGPCGGSQGGRCEISPDVDCVWQQIHDKMLSLGLEEDLKKILGPKSWSWSKHGGPRTLKKEGFEP